MITLIADHWEFLILNAQLVNRLSAEICSNYFLDDTIPLLQEIVWKGSWRASHVMWSGWYNAFHWPLSAVNACCKDKSKFLFY